MAKQVLNVIVAKRRKPPSQMAIQRADIVVISGEVVKNRTTFESVRWADLQKTLVAEGYGLNINDSAWIRRAEGRGY